MGNVNLSCWCQIFQFWLPNNIFCGNLAVWQTSEQVVLAQHVPITCDMPMGWTGRFCQCDGYYLTIVSCSVFQHRWMHLETFQKSTIYTKIIMGFFCFQKVLLVTIIIFNYNDLPQIFMEFFKNWKLDKCDSRIVSFRYFLPFPQGSEW